METVISINIQVKVTNCWNNLLEQSSELYTLMDVWGLLFLSLEISLWSNTKLGLSMEKGKNDNNWMKSNCCVTEVLRLDDLIVLWSWSEAKKPHQKSNKTKKPQPDGWFANWWVFWVWWHSLFCECPNSSCGLSVNDLLCPGLFHVWTGLAAPVMTTSY